MPHLSPILDWAQVVIEKKMYLKKWDSPDYSDEWVTFFAIEILADIVVMFSNWAIKL